MPNVRRDGTVISKKGEMMSEGLKRARLAAQILIDEIGADGPEHVADTARRAVAIIRKLRAEQQAMQDGAKPAPPSAEGE